MREQILKLANEIYDAAQPKRTVKAHEFAMEDNPDAVVVHEVDIKWGDERLRIATTADTARPPFEWLVEISSDVGDADYFKHYLIRDNDVVLAQRKVLTPIDQDEADLIMSDLRAAQAHIE
ncbi:MAG TPA: hypothetical protein VMS08_02205 [Candidatus Saccharimonadia bacterium]|nr:hypothetical protein [Candidatus Saccharimonadia bacterium]